MIRNHFCEILDGNYCFEHESVVANLITTQAEIRQIRIDSTQILRTETTRYCQIATELKYQNNYCCRAFHVGWSRLQSGTVSILDRRYYQTTIRTCKHAKQMFLPSQNTNQAYKMTNNCIYFDMKYFVLNMRKRKAQSDKAIIHLLSISNCNIRC